MSRTLSATMSVDNSDQRYCTSFDLPRLVRDSLARQIANGLADRRLFDVEKNSNFYRHADEYRTQINVRTMDELHRDDAEKRLLEGTIKSLRNELAQANARVAELTKHVSKLETVRDASVLLLNTTK